MTADQVRRIEARYQRASQRAEQVRAERDNAIRALIAAGWTHARVSEATGLTRGRIGQIALGKR